MLCTTSSGSDSRCAVPNGGDHRVVYRHKIVASALSALLSVVVCHTASAQATPPWDPGKGGKEMAGQKTHHAIGRTDVKTYSPTSFDEIADGPSLLEIQVTETFSGDIQGDGTVRVIQAARKDGTASFVGIERVRGSIAGQSGSFLLQLTGTVVGKEMKSEGFVVPGSGIGELKGLRGQGGFKAQLGKHGSIWLDYYFE
jgi:hypothetical protein